MIDTPRIVRADAQPAAVIHITVPRNEIQSVMGPGRAELVAFLAARGITPTGPWFTHHLRMHPGTFDFEIGFPVAEPIEPSGRVRSGELPAATVARVVYHGGYEGLGGAWAEVNAWLAANGHTAAPGLWECFVAGPESDPDPATWRTELNRPLVV